MIIKSNIRDYKVELLNNLDFIYELKEIPYAIFAIDKKVYELYKSYFEDISEEKLVLIEAKEDNKNLSTVIEICHKFTKMSAKRNATLVTIGGGITQDISGFAANILYRGINWVLVPTTLLSACDSCIGSKTSLNFDGNKNLLGTFYPPSKILICADFFNTLSVEDFKSGLGEVVKFNVMNGTKSIKELEDNMQNLLNRNNLTLNFFVKKSLIFKKPYVERDEFDLGDRIALNFAHTFGHAIETVSNYQVPHGSAVAIGLLMANHISYERKLLNEENKMRIENLVLQIVDIKLKKEWFDTKQITAAMKKDKKRINEELAAVILNNDFETLVIQDLKENEVVNTIGYITKKLGIGA